jgi:flagellar motility protein MotE (MotC chaperone)
MIKLLQSPLTAMLLGGVSFLFTMFALVEKPLRDSVHHEPMTEEEAQIHFWSQHNPEVDQLLQELRREKEDLARREGELKKLAEQLQAERAAITTVTQRVARLQAEFDQNVIRVKDDEVPQLKKLVKVYSTMSPEGAAAIFKELDDQTVVKLMSLMKEELSASMLDSMAKEGPDQAKRAAALAEALRHVLPDKKKQT